MPAPLPFTMRMVIFINDMMLANTPAHVASSSQLALITPRCAFLVGKEQRSTALA